MRNKMKKVNIFIDTNILEIPNKRLTEFKFNETYYKLKNFIKYNNYSNFNIIIPKIVLDELCKHYIEEYTRIEMKLENIDKEYNAIQSDITKLGYELNIERKNFSSISEYKEYIKKCFNKYILEENENIEIIQYPNQEKFHSIIKRAIEKKRPFFTGEYRGKKFSDAGFKDVIFVESIKEKMDLEDADYIIITKDKIVNGLNWNEEIVGKNGKSINYDTGIDIVNFICEEYNIKDLSEYIEFSKEKYFSDQIFNAVNDILQTVGNINIVEEEDVVIEIECVLNNIGDVIISLDETKGFLDIRNLDGEVIYQW